MLSLIFSKKKNSVETPPEDIIQGPVSNNIDDNSDFIIVEKKNDSPSEIQSNIYPPMPPYPPAVGKDSIGDSVCGNGGGSGSIGHGYISYMRDVPFVLAPHLFSNYMFDIMQTQVDGILAFLTRQMSINEENEYAFTVERSILNEIE